MASTQCYPAYTLHNMNQLNIYLIPKYSNDKTGSCLKEFFTTVTVIVKVVPNVKGTCFCLHGHDRTEALVILGSVYHSY